MIKRETVDKIFDAIHIEEVIGDFVSLKKSGNNYKGFSPFTTETNPSFFVSPAKNIFKCFSSGKGGNAVKFLMELEHYTYPEALRYIAKKYGIEIEEEERTPEEVKEMNERETLFHINAFTQKFFEDQLHNTEEGKAVGLSYLKERGYKTETITKFQVGYSPADWDALTKHAIKEGYKKEYLVKLGLIIEKDANRSYDRFRNRIIFPIHNISGRVLGFGGRILTADENKPKYVNSPESDIYNKSKVLYGLYYAKTAVIREDVCYLVEGYTDVISLFQAGIENVVSSSGTSLTADQIRLIKRYTPNITILYDGDPAGIKASFRGIDLILEEGMNVKIVLFPDGEDPDSFASNRPTSEVVEFIKDNSNDFITFKTNLLREESKNDPVKKAGLIKEIIETISLIPDNIYRTIYIRECSTILEIPEQTLMNELNKLLRRKYKKKLQQEQRSEDLPPEPTEYTATKQIDKELNISEYQEKDIIRLLLNYANDEITVEDTDEKKQKVEVPVKVAVFVINDLLQDDIRFNNPLYQNVLDEYRMAIEKDFIPDAQYFVGHEREDVAHLAVNLLSSPYELSDNWKKVKIFVATEKERLKLTIETSLMALKAKEIEKQIRSNQERLKDITEESVVNMILEEQKELKDISRQINRKLSRIIVK